MQKRKKLEADAKFTLGVYSVNKSVTQWWSLAWASRAVARGPPTLFCALQGPPQKS